MPSAVAILQAAEDSWALALYEAIVYAWLGGGSEISLPDVPEGLPPPPEKPPFEPIGELFPDEKPKLKFLKIEAAADDMARRNVVNQSEFRGLSLAARRLSFTAASERTEDGLNRLRSVVETTIREGADLDGFRRRLETELDGSTLGDWYSEVVYRTNVQQAYAEGQDHILRNPLVVDEFPYRAYFAIHDDRVDPEHLAMETLGLDGTNVYNARDPVIRKFRPPWRWNCRCGLVAYTIAQAAAAGVKEAQEWLKTGIAPSRFQFVRHPPFDLPAGWQPNYPAGTA